MGFGGKEEGSRGYSPYLHSHSHLPWLEKRIEERRGEGKKRRREEERRRGEGFKLGFQEGSSLREGKR